MVDEVRVAQVYRDHFLDVPGGIERHISELAHHMGRGVTNEVMVASRSRRSREWMDGDVLVRTSAQLARVQGVPLCPTLPKDIRSGNYDLVHLHSPNPTGEIAYALSGTQAPAIITYHCDLSRAPLLVPIYRRILEGVIKRCERVIVSSERLIQSSPLLRSLARERRQDIEVIPFGVDLDRFSPEVTEHSKHLRRRWGPGPIVLFVGRIRYYKGLEELVYGMRKVNARLVVVGGGPRTLAIRKLGSEVLGDRFVSERHMSDQELPECYRAADVFCLPSVSRAETFGISALEAMACGTPVVTTEVGTATSLINQHGETGLVVRPKDPAALGSALSTMIEDSDLRAEMGRAARRRAVAEYDQVDMLQSIRDLYLRVVREPRLSA